MMTLKRINTLIVIVVAFTVLTAIQTSVEIARAKRTVERSRETLAKAAETLDAAQNLITIDPSDQTIRLRLEHAPMGLILCLNFNGAERCRVAREWQEWIAQHADAVAEVRHQ